MRVFKLNRLLPRTRINNIPSIALYLFLFFFLRALLSIMDQVGILLSYIIIDTAYCFCSTPPALNIKRITHIWDAALFLADVSK